MRFAGEIEEREKVALRIREPGDVVYTHVVEHVRGPTVKNLHESAGTVVTAGVNVVHRDVVDAVALTCQGHCSVTVRGKRVGDFNVFSVVID